jgi:hypothetical protein
VKLSQGVKSNEYDAWSKTGIFLPTQVAFPNVFFGKANYTHSSKHSVLIDECSASFFGRLEGRVYG